jgi:hypothetical protein
MKFTRSILFLREKREDENLGGGKISNVKL